MGLFCLKFHFVEHSARFSHTDIRAHTPRHAYAHIHTLVYIISGALFFIILGFNILLHICPA